MNTSAIITPDELAVLNLLVRDACKVVLAADTVQLQCYSPHKKLLFAYDILPGTSSGYAGDKLAAVLEDLAGTVRTLFQVYKESDTPVFERIMKIVNGASESVTTRLLQNREFSIITAQIYTVAEEDWVG